MEYSALIYDDCLDENDSFENLVHAIDVFGQDKRCKQIVVSCSSQWLLKLAQKPRSKVMLVKIADAPYVALLNGLKAVIMENVVVSGLSISHEIIDVDKVIEHLKEYPAIYLDKDLQAFDTRLLMFCLQQVIESNLVIQTYADALTSIGNPIKYL